MAVGRWLALVPLLGMLLAAPSLTLGLHAIDDPMHRSLILDRLSGHGGADPWYELFSLVGTDEKAAAAERVALLRPWYAYDGLRIRFLRPVAAITHYVDYALWPNAYWAMHLQNVLWYGLACFIVALLCWRLSADPRIAWIGALIYALDDAHAETSSWIANRNALVATVFAALALLFHHENRLAPRWHLRLLAPFLFGVSLFSAESAMGMLAFFLAYVLFLDRRRLRTRLLSMLPVAAVFVGWFVLHRALGYGARGSGFYLDPLTDAPALLDAAPLRALYLLRSQFAGLQPLSPTLPDAIMVPVRAAGEWFLFPALVVWAIRRVDVDRELAFWLFGALLSMVPLLSVPPHERLLIIAGVGWSMAFANLAVSSWDSLRERHGAGRVLPGAILVAIVTIHGVFAPMALFTKSLTFGSQDEDPALKAPSLDRQPGLEQTHLVVLNSPSQLHGALIPRERARHGLPVPRALSVLGSTIHRVEVTRVNDRTFELSTPFGYLLDVFSSFWRSPSHPIAMHHPIRVNDFKAEVEWSIVDGRPQRVRFTFDRPLEDPSYRFIIWDGNNYKPFKFAALGIHKSEPASYDDRRATPFP